MIDRTVGTYAGFLTAVGVRLEDAEARLHVLDRDDRAPVGVQRRAFFVYPLDGPILMRREGHPDVVLERGAAGAIEEGTKLELVANETATRVLVSSIGQKQAFIRGLPEGCLVVAPDQQPVARIIASAVDLMVAVIEEGVDETAVIRRASEIIMLQLLRHVQSGIATQSDAPPEGILHDPYLLRSWAAFHNEPTRKWTLNELAEISGLSRSAYVARVKKAFGRPPLEMITQMRLERAKHLLRSSRASMLEIATDIGYGSDAAFIRAFTRELGMTPGAWRRGASSQDETS